MEVTKKSISIIIPIYNSEKYLLRALDSLFQSSSNALEYIFIDDASADKSLAMLYDYIDVHQIPKAIVKIISLVENKGSANARNEGLKIATGEYIAFFDADDWIAGDGYADMYNYAVEKNLDIVWTDFYYSDGKTHERKIQDLESNSIQCIKNLLKERLHGALWNKLYKRELFVANSIYFPSGQDYWEDLSTNVILFSKADSVGYLNKAFYYYFQGNENSLGSKSLEKKISQIVNNCNRIIEYLNKNYRTVFDVEINYLKLASKQTLLFTTEIQNFYSWENLYREANKYILKFSSLPLHLRIIGYSCAYRQWWIAHLYINIKKALK